MPIPQYWKSRTTTHRHRDATAQAGVVVAHRFLVSPVALLFAALLSVLMTACSKDGTERPVRPGEEEEILIPADVRFVNTHIEIAVDGSPAEGAFEVTLERSGDRLPDTTYTLTCDDADKCLTVPAVIHFEEEQTTVTVSASYSISLEPLELYSATICAYAFDGAEAVCVRVDIYRPSEWQQSGTGTYATGAHAIDVNIQTRVFDGGRQYRVWDADDVSFIRTFTRYDDGTISVDDGVTDIDDWTGFVSSDGYATVEYTNEMLKAIMPIYTLSSIYDEDGGYYGLCLTYFNDATFEPRYDVLRIDGEQDVQWRRLEDATFVDGWLVGVVSFRLEEPPLPADSPWPIEAWVNVDAPDIIRLMGLYRVASPLSKINSCDWLTPVEVHLETDSFTAAIAGTFSGFDNSDLFSSPFYIKGDGSYAIDDDGNTVITIENPMHTAYGEYGTWATPYATVITLHDHTTAE